MLKFLQEQWDTQMLEVYQLKESLQQTRKELSHALYQHDAACQCIARLETEKEQLQAQLDQNRAQIENMKQAFEQQAQQMPTSFAEGSGQKEESKQAQAPTQLS